MPSHRHVGWPPRPAFRGSTVRSAPPQRDVCDHHLSGRGCHSHHAYAPHAGAAGLSDPPKRRLPDLAETRRRRQLAVDHLDALGP